MIKRSLQIHVDLLGCQASLLTAAATLRSKKKSKSLLLPNVVITVKHAALPIPPRCLRPGGVAAVLPASSLVGQRESLTGATIRQVSTAFNKHAFTRMNYRL